MQHLPSGRFRHKEMCIRDRDKPYTIEVFCGNYDVPVKGADKEIQWESEEVYRFLVVAVCPTVGELSLIHIYDKNDGDVQEQIKH